MPVAGWWWGVVAAAVAAAGACGGGGEEGPRGPVAFVVRVVGGDVGRPDARLPFSLEGVEYSIDIEAVPPEAMPEGWVAIRVEPGDVLAVDAPGAIRSNVPLVGGRASGVRVTIAKAYGDTRIWVQDLGFVPGPVAEAQCVDGVDNDGDGLIDYGADPGCAFSNDDSETEGSHAVGVTEPLYVANPRIADVQGFSSESPLLGRSITIDGGEMVVTRVSVDGLYVTDISETRGYASLFAYNFNTPHLVRVCDRLAALAGIVGEFYGYTELGFPSWTVDPDAVRADPLPAGPHECPVPEPVELDAAAIDDVRAMESLEAGLVRVTSGTIAARFVDCDLDGSGGIDFGTAEEICADGCEAELDCTESSQYRRYGQFGVATAAADPANRRKVLVVVREVYPEFDAIRNAGRIVALIRGTLKQIEFLENPWIVEIRCRDDFVMTGTPRPMWEACVPPLDDDEGHGR